MPFEVDDIETIDPSRLVDDIEEVDVKRLKPVKKTSSPKKTSTIAPKQEFFTPLPPHPLTPKSPFHLETTPYHQPAEDRIQRHIKLKDPNTKFVRASTPEQKQQLADVEAEQQAYEKLGPTLYGVREGLNRGVKSLASMFT